MLSAHTRNGAEATMEALAAGAADFIDKQSLNLMDLDRLGRELGGRIRSLGELPAVRGRQPRLSGPIVPSGTLDPAELVVIGASTGGPAALQKLLEGLPRDFPAPIAIVQHMPPGFTRPFAARLNLHSRLRVAEAEHGIRLVAGQAVIAPAGRHLSFTGRLEVVLSSEPAQARHIPSVNVMMLSAARVRPGRVLAVLLTGMGDDGAEGMVAIRAGGGVTVAEAEESCVVYGMPRAAAERGGADHQMPIAELAEWLAAFRAGSPSAAPVPR
jgi:two-component system chemotaxis response regulator CheB